MQYLQNQNLVQKIHNKQTIKILSKGSNSITDFFSFVSGFSIAWHGTLYWYTTLDFPIYWNVITCNYCLLYKVYSPECFLEIRKVLNVCSKQNKNAWSVTLVYLGIAFLLISLKTLLSELKIVLFCCALSEAQITNI